MNLKDIKREKNYRSAEFIIIIRFKNTRVPISWNNDFNQSSFQDL